MVKFRPGPAAWSDLKARLIVSRLTVVIGRAGTDRSRHSMRWRTIRNYRSSSCYLATVRGSRKLSAAAADVEGVEEIDDRGRPRRGQHHRRLRMLTAADAETSVRQTTPAPILRSLPQRCPWMLRSEPTTDARQRSLELRPNPISRVRTQIDDTGAATASRRGRDSAGRKLPDSQAVDPHASHAPRLPSKGRLA